MKPPTITLLPVLLLTALLSADALAQSLSPIVELDRIVAVVNDDVIVASELRQRVRSVRAQLRDAGTPLPPDDVLVRQVLDRLVLDRLQLQVATLNGIRVADEQLNAAMNNIARQNNISLSEFRDILERDGFDFLKFREEIREQMLVQMVQQRQVENRVVVSQRDIDNHLATRAIQGAPDEEYRLLHILVGTPEAASPEAIEAARQRADEVIRRVQAGAGFAETAVALSDGQQALQGGDLGWRRAPELPSVFADVVGEMQTGDVRGPIRSASGFHIVQLADRRGGGTSIVTQTSARHVLLRTSELLSDDDARLRLLQLKERIENGEDFGAIARSHSDDRATAINDGSLGWLSPGDVVPLFEQEMSALAPGAVSEPFLTQFGWHIVQVLDRRDHDDSEAVARQRAREQIRQRKVAEEMESWLRQLRDEAYVEYRIDE